MESLCFFENFLDEAKIFTFKENIDAIKR